MEKRIFISVNNPDIEQKIKDSIHVVGSNPDLDFIIDSEMLLDNIDILIIDKKVDEGGNKILKIASLAKNRTFKIIIINDNIKLLAKNDLINFLIACKVYAYINYSDINAENLSNCFDNYPESFDYALMGGIKLKIIEKEKIIVEIKERIKTINTVRTKVIKQEIITFYSTDNSIEKEDILTQISVLLAKKSNQKILVIDMNTETPTLDHFFNVDKQIDIKDRHFSKNYTPTGLEAVYNSISKGIFNSKLLSEFVINIPKFNNLDLLTGFYSLDLCEKVGADSFKNLIDASKEIYDVVIINTHPDLFKAATYVAIASSTKTLVVSNANYTSGRNTNFILNELIFKLNIRKDKFKIIINNISKNSLSADIMTKIFEEYEMYGYIPYNGNKETCLNNRKFFIISKSAKKDVIHYLDILEKLGYIPKITLMSRLFKKKKYNIEIMEEEV